ncbi:hypothetical protein [uncultured Roseobacter sp.]|nr:hypothetical protein [uncultured Roseobacter sp.]
MRESPRDLYRVLHLAEKGSDAIGDTVLGSLALLPPVDCAAADFA